MLRHFLRHIGREVYACMGFLIMAQTPEKLGLWRCIAGNRRTFRYENRHPISIPSFIKEILLLIFNKVLYHSTAQSASTILRRNAEPYKTPEKRTVCAFLRGLFSTADGNCNFLHPLPMHRIPTDESQIRSACLRNPDPAQPQ